MKASTEIEIRFADLDAYRHVNNAAYFTFIETARFKLFREYFTEIMATGLQFLVVEANCRYLEPIGLNDPLVIDVEFQTPERSSFILNYILHSGKGKIYAEARTVMVCFDSSLGKTVRVPDQMRLAFEG